MNILGSVFLIIGGFFFAVAGLGLLRMPDVYTRAQTATKATTLGTFCTLVGVGFFNPSWFPKLILIIIFIAITNPVGSSTLIRAAYKKGVGACEQTKTDEYSEFAKKEDE